MVVSLAGIRKALKSVKVAASCLTPLLVVCLGLNLLFVLIFIAIQFWFAHDDHPNINLFYGWSIAIFISYGASLFCFSIVLLRYMRG